MNPESPTYTVGDLHRSLSKCLDEALYQPVRITRSGRLIVVLISSVQYKELMDRLCVAEAKLEGIRQGGVKV